MAILKLITLGHYYKLIDSSFKSAMNRISKKWRRRCGLNTRIRESGQGNWYCPNLISLEYLESPLPYLLATAVYKRPGVSTLIQLSHSVWNRIKELR